MFGCLQREVPSPGEHHTLNSGLRAPGLSKVSSVLYSIDLNVPADYLFTLKFKLRNPSGKDERKGRRIAGQQKQNRREACAQIVHISTPHPLQGGRRFLNPQNPARVFLGKDWSLCSMLVLDFFTLTPTPGAPSPSPHFPCLGKSGAWTPFGRTAWKHQSLSKEGEVCPRVLGHTAECRDGSGLLCATFCVPKERILQKRQIKAFHLLGYAYKFLVWTLKIFPSPNCAGREMNLSWTGKNVVQVLFVCFFQAGR